MLDRDVHQAEVDGNFEFFREQLPQLLSSERGRYALIRHREIIEVFDTLNDAMITGKKLFEDRLFSVQQVTDTSIDLGFFSHAVHLG